MFCPKLLPASFDLARLLDNSAVQQTTIRRHVPWSAHVGRGGYVAADDHGRCADQGLRDGCYYR